MPKVSRLEESRPHDTAGFKAEREKLFDSDLRRVILWQQLRAELRGVWAVSAMRCVGFHVWRCA